MNIIEETRKRLEISKNISSQLTGIVKGVLVGGSMGFGQNFSVNEKSDIDLVVVCDREDIGKLEKTDYFKNSIHSHAQTLFENGEISCIWVTREINSIEVNTFIYETKGYLGHCLLKNNLKIFISSRPSETQSSYGFEGNLLTFKRNIIPFQEGYIYDRPNLVEGKFVSVPPRDDFTRGFFPLFQENGFFDKLREKVWSAIINQLVKEKGFEVDLNEASILNAEYVYQVRPEKLPPKIIEGIKEETLDRLNKLKHKQS